MSNKRRPDYQVINNETIRVENIRSIKGPCDVSICNNSFILAGTGDILDVLEIKNRCDCVKKKVCMEVARLLSEKKKEEALDFLTKNIDE